MLPLMNRMIQREKRRRLQNKKKALPNDDDNTKTKFVFLQALYWKKNNKKK